MLEILVAVAVAVISGVILALIVKPIWDTLRRMLCRIGLHSWENLGFLVSDPTKDRYECRYCPAFKDVPNGCAGK